MQHIIFTSKFYCELCKQEVSIPLFGDNDSSFTPNDEPELIEWGRHYHWIDFHRVCAVCGKIVKSGDLELAINDGMIKIHKDYTNHYKRIEQGNRGPLLIVHEGCVNK
jgi:hypothetical protein